jgi:predicted transcriptional regulator
MTSVELPPKLHERVRIYAVRTRTSLRAVIEEALLDLLRRKE